MTSSRWNRLIGGPSARFAILLVLLVPLLRPAVPAAGAQSGCVGEEEANNEPGTANPIAGEGCVEAEIGEDGQDLFRWTVDEEDAGTRWDLSATGIPEQVIRVVVLRDDPAGGTPAQLADFATTVAGSEVRAEGLVFAPGEYLVAVTASGPGPYRLALAAGDELADIDEDEPNDDVASAETVEGAFAVGGDLEGSADVVAWTLGKAEAKTRWTLAAQTAVGQPLTLALDDADGADVATVSADALGRVSLDGLGLAAGTYAVTVSPPAEGSARYQLEATEGAPRSADVEEEPNERPEQAFPFDPAGPVYGRISSGGDVDHYRLTVDGELAAATFDLTLMAGPGLDRKLCLVDAAGADLVCREGTTGLVALNGLVLPEGDYALRVSGSADPVDEYSIDVLVLGGVDRGIEAEPNDAVTVPNAIEPGGVVQGTLAGSDSDFYRMTVTGDPQLWRVEAVGSGIETLRWADANGTVLGEGQIAPGNGRGELTDLFLSPGDHWFEVRGTDGSYALQATPLGPPEANGERETNNDAVRAEPMLVGETRTGRLVDLNDVDLYRFSLAARDHVVVSLTSPAEALLELRVSAGGEEIARWDAAAAGESYAYDGLLEPGDYLLTVVAPTPSTARYALAVERADPFALADDQEPNGNAATARPLTADRAVSGTIDLENDQDWYALPANIEPAVVRLVVAGDDITARVSDGVAQYDLEPDGDGGPLVPVEALPQDVPLWVVLSGTGDYTVGLDDGGGGGILDLPVFAGAPSALPVTATLAVETTEVAAYATVGQRVAGALTLTSAADETLTLTLAAVTSHYAWRADLGQETVEVAPGTTVSVPVRVAIQPDAWANVPVRVSVGVSGEGGGTASAFAEITPTGAAALVAPEVAWTVPEALLGGLDVAAASQGATVVGASFPDDEAQLHDGITPDGLGYVVEPPLPLTTTVDLAGDAPLPIAGFLVNPQAGDATTRAPRRVELQLSTDGATFETVYAGELSPLPIEQPIVLEAPVEATQARLVVLSAYGAKPLEPYAVGIGEWKVVAAPGARSEPGLDGNVASGLVGGHVVELSPQGSDDPGFPLSIVDEDTTAWSMPVEDGTRPSFVVGFQNDRAARISELQWVDPAGSNPETRFDEVAIEVSLASPLGPWEPLGTWALERAGDGRVAPWVLDEVTWARFVRFTGPPVDDLHGYPEYPATVRVIEAAEDGYLSILGEWGANRPEGIYERLNPPELTAVGDEDDASDTPEGATPLAAGEAASGRAAIGVDVDWYAATIPDGQNTLTLDVTGQPVVDVTVEIVDAEGQAVTARREPGDVPSAVRYVAEVEPGATYRVRVAQPQHSIAIAFDTSGSIGPFYDAVFQALRSYTRGVEPGQEYVNILAFDEEPLLPGWTDDPYALSTAISRYRLSGGSSSAEAGILASTELLAGQEGAKAILLITDAETSSYEKADEMWAALQGVAPRIFAVHIGATTTHDQSQDWMQDWAISGDGSYQYTRTQAEMDRAFDRAATWLRRPAGYGISYATSQTSTEPGSLRVVSPPVDAAAGEARASTISDAVSVEIIYDTSGSMLAAMPDGQRRVDAARAVLVDLVSNRIPAGVPVALRVFGDAPGSCDTTLAVPLAPLDQGAMAATIAAIEPVNEVKTPIGASLDAVSSDLAGVAGPKIVILVTDGEETCEGDAEAAIARLAADGVDVQVNIVGFALDDEALKTTFRRWARLGNGTYFDATNAEELDAAIARAVQAPFRVYDAAGELVASGTVDGGSVRLPAGTYRVVVLTDPETVYEAVAVEPEAKVKLTVGEEAPGG